MIYQSSVNFDGKSQRVFFEFEDYAKINLTGYHTHKFNEFIFLESGTITYEVGNKRYDLCAGGLLVIPSGEVHRCTECGNDLKFFHMMTDGNVPRTVMTQCDINILKEIIDLSRTFDEKNVIKLRMLVIMLCYDVFGKESFEVSRQVDYDYLIDRCIAVDSTIEEFADMLGVSTRHASRLVLKYQGKSFKQIRLGIRMGIAKTLLERGKEKPSDIAKYVGYDSYKGFSNAYKKYYGLSDKK